MVSFQYIICLEDLGPTEGIVLATLLQITRVIPEQNQTY